jgi:hypothetical protein
LIGVRLLWFDGLVLYAHALALAGVGADFLSLGHITSPSRRPTSIEMILANTAITTF